MNSVACSNYRKAALEQKALNIIKNFDCKFSNEIAVPTPIEDIIEMEYKLNLEFHHIKKTLRVLGMTIYDDGLVPLYNMETKEYGTLYIKGGTIIIDSRLLEERKAGRYRFTCAHELAHWLLHREAYQGSNESAAKYNGTQDHTTERDADILATALLMPAGCVKIAFHRATVKTNIVDELAQMFNVSHQAMEIRLKSFSLI